MKPGWSIRLSAAAICLASAAGCRLSADYEDTEFLCGDGICPAGQLCIDGRCRRAADAGTAVDATADAAPALRCGTIALLTDDFADGVIGPAWDDSFDNAVTMAETGGELVFTMPAGATGSAAYVSDSSYDLRGARLWVEVLEVPDPATTQEAQLILRTDVDDRVVMKVEAGTLHMYHRDEGVQGGLLSIPYQAADHRFWALREDNGVLHFETSTDGATWQPRHSIDQPPVDLSQVIVQLGAAAYDGSTVDGLVRFDDLNGGGAPAGAWCTARSLTDDFEDGIISWRWAQAFDSTGCTIDENGGQAVIDLASGSTTHCAFYTGSTYDLRNDAVQVEVVQMISTSMVDVRAYLRAWLDGDNYFDILQEDGTLSARTKVAGVWTTLASTPFSLTTHHFWRIREALGTVYWETSPDGIDWTLQAEAADPFDLSGVQFGLGGQALTAPTADPGHIRFDRYNLP